MIRSRFFALSLLPLLAACSDQRATFEIDGSAHSLSLIRITGMPWESTAKYAIVPTRMPDCMRRHALPDAPDDAKVEVYSPGNNAWIIKQNGRLFVTETRTCEGFAPLDKAPEDGLGAPMGVFEMRNDTLVFTAAPKPAASPAPMPAPVSPPPLPPTDSCRQDAYNRAGKSVRQPPRALARGGKSGLRRAGCRLTAGHREVTESATENRPPKSGETRAGKGETVG